MGGYKSGKGYFNNCCYNRPFDDRSNIKNYLEREAVLIIMQMAYEENIRIVRSEVLKKEMSLISGVENNFLLEVSENEYGNSSGKGK